MLNLIMGMLLGDSCISKRDYGYRLSTTHCVAQYRYLLWKSQQFGVPENRIKPRISGKGTLQYRFHYSNIKLLKYVYNTCVINGHKKVTQEWIKHLNTLSLAVWYQDDGSWCEVGRKSPTTGIRYSRRVEFHTSGFDLESVELLSLYLTNLDLKNKIKLRKKKYHNIILHHKAVLDLWHRISHLVILNYKIDSRILL